jgi:hypothetical protein
MKRINKMFYIYRIRKYKNGRLAPGVGKKLALAFGDADTNVLTSRLPKKQIPYASIVLNYGRAQEPDWNRDDITILNRPECVAVGVNKLTALRAMENCGVAIPQYTDDPNHIDKDGSLWVARTLLRSSKGKGIILFKAGIDETPVAPLYTKYYPKTHEFRIHVFNDEVIDYVQKKKKLNFPHEVNMKVRNHAKGWVFAKNNIYHYPELEAEALEAMAAIGLDFGAVDIMARLRPLGLDGKRTLIDYKVAEVNSAPGMSSKNTLDIYVNRIKEFLNHRFY